VTIIEYPVFNVANGNTTLAYIHEVMGALNGIDNKSFYSFDTDTV